jgi:hypothetical protein
MFSGNLHDIGVAVSEAKTNIRAALAILHHLKHGTEQLTPAQVKEMVEEAEHHLKKIGD